MAEIVQGHVTRCKYCGNLAAQIPAISRLPLPTSGLTQTCGFYGLGKTFIALILLSIVRTMTQCVSKISVQPQNECSSRIEGLQFCVACFLVFYADLFVHSIVWISLKTRAGWHFAFGSGLLTVLYLPPPFLARLQKISKAWLDSNLLFDIGLGGLAFTATGSLTAQSEGRGERREAQLSSLSSVGLLGKSREEQRPNFHHQPAQNPLNKILPITIFVLQV